MAKKKSQRQCCSYVATQRSPQVTLFRWTAGVRQAKAVIAATASRALDFQALISETVHSQNSCAIIDRTRFEGCVARLTPLRWRRPAQSEVQIWLFLMLGVSAAVWGSNAFPTQSGHVQATPVATINIPHP